MNSGEYLPCCFALSKYPPLFTSTSVNNYCQLMTLYSFWWWMGNIGFTILTSDWCVFHEAIISVHSSWLFSSNTELKDKNVTSKQSFNTFTLNSSILFSMPLLFNGKLRKCVKGIFCLEDSVMTSIRLLAPTTPLLWGPVITEKRQINANEKGS